ncbi:MAG: UDP-N-acetylglucosamine 1-carboxyvinyltransferase [Defluviitaleaceae bacterium]|nr:UDP-N-acetylglucosamine 1-carboxyvinyltransferase [Defluviitaleaceae bacterium]
MGEYYVTGGCRLSGELAVHGGKNAVLPILAACMLNAGESLLTDCPNISDTRDTIEILQTLGCKVTREGSTITVNSEPADTYTIAEELARKMRSSIVFLGSLLARFGSASVSYPGGCVLGLRPIDQHIKGLRELGARIIDEHGFLTCTASQLIGKNITLDYPSVGATQNIMLAAVLAKGTTTITNAAMEPEIAELAKFLNAMGADVTGAGEPTITIHGVKELRNAQHRVMPDRIVAGTYLVAAAITKGDITLTNVFGSDIRPVTAKLAEAGCEITESTNGLRLVAPPKLRAIRLKTQPHPGFPTDMQQQFTAMLALADGTSIIEETVFEARNSHIPELCRMRANITQVNDGRTSVIQGVPRLASASVSSHDLRGGAALILAGLAAEGTTTISPSHHITRGYESIEADLRALGADIVFNK